MEKSPNPGLDDANRVKRGLQSKQQQAVEASKERRAQKKAKKLEN